jgi:hypothetical protein
MTDPVEGLIFTMRHHRVLLDADLARLYGVSTKRFNEATKRNRKRFPTDFAFQLTLAEVALLRAQVTDSARIAGNRSQFATSSSRRRSRAYRPWAFTEHGALMAANVLRSERAIQMSVYVIRAFVRMREGFVANAAILKRLAEIDKNLLAHDVALRDIYRKLVPLLQPPADPPKRRIGFHTEEG